jgi:hypothetical protein
MRMEITFGNFAAIDGNQMIRHNSFSVALTVTQHGLEKDMTKQGTFAVIASVMLLALAGCATAQEMQQRDAKACNGYGFKSGTPDFDHCLQNESLARRYELGPDWSPTFHRW